MNIEILFEKKKNFRLRQITLDNFNCMKEFFFLLEIIADHDEMQIMRKYFHLFLNFFICIWKFSQKIIIKIPMNGRIMCIRCLIELNQFHLIAKYHNVDENANNKNFRNKI